MIRYRYMSTVFKQGLFFCVLSAFVTCGQASAAGQDLADWTILVYVQANNNLAPWAQQNFSDMTEHGSNQHLNVLVQAYQPNHKGTLRYRIEKGRMTLDTHLTADTDGNSAAELVDAMRWAVTKYPAKKYGLILWDHGIGIVDPVWGKMGQGKGRELFPMDQSMVEHNPRIQISEITVQAVDLVCDTVELVCQQVASFCQGVIGFSNTVQHAANNSDTNHDGIISNPELLQAAIEIATEELAQQNSELEQQAQELVSRAILFNENKRTYMDNQTLINALTTIRTQVLGGKKIDLLGMDACLMAMLEVGYQLRESAQYFVASQEVELARGWSYPEWLKALSVPNVSAAELAQLIVKTYGQYYQDKVSFYTQSAVDLDKLGPVSNNLQNVVQKLRACAQIDKQAVLQLLNKARRNCVQFSAFGYIDLHSWYDELDTLLQQSMSPALSGSVSELRGLLAHGKRLVQESVLANVAGKTLAKAKGISIYYPQVKIDESYARTMFARDNQWCRFLQEFVLAG